MALPGAATRIVSLVPSATQTLDALGARAAVVGRTDYDTLTWAADLPSVGGGIRPSMEALISLEPDLVVLFGGEQDFDTPARLDELGIPWVGVRPDRIDDVLNMIRVLGQATGQPEQAGKLIDEIRRGLDRIGRDRRQRPSPRVAYVMGGTPPWVAGPNTFIDELIELAGGTNAFGDLDALYSAVNPEELIARDIDVVLVSDRSAFEHRFAPGARVEMVDGDIQLPGPGVVRVARDVAEAIQGRRR